MNSFSNMGSRVHYLLRYTPNVDASATELLVLNNAHFRPVPSGSLRKGEPSATTTNDKYIVLLLNGELNKGVPIAPNMYLSCCRHIGARVSAKSQTQVWTSQI